MISHRLATRHELETVYGLEDLYDFVEILVTDAYNRRQAAKKD